MGAKNQTWLFLFKAIIAVSAFVSMQGNAATPVGEIAAMQSKANKSGYVRIIVSLDMDSSLNDIMTRRNQIKQLASQKESALLAELGDNYIKGTLFRSEHGVIAIHVNSVGLSAILKSKNVRQFEADYVDRFNLGVPDNGELDRIESAIERSGTAQVSITLNIDHALPDSSDRKNRDIAWLSAQEKEARALIPSLLKRYSIT